MKLDKKITCDIWGHPHPDLAQLQRAVDETMAQQQARLAQSDKADTARLIALYVLGIGSLFGLLILILTGLVPL